MLRLAPAPIRTPLGLRRKKFAAGMSVFESIRPKMEDGSPPVTRLMTLVIEAGPLKVAVWLLGTLNCPKLWNRLFPLLSPAEKGITKFGPVSGPLCAPGLMVPSSVI